MSDLTHDDPIVQMLFAECETGKATRRSVAVIYALLMARGGHKLGSEFWPAIHDAIMKAFGYDSVLKIDPIKRMAWDIYEATARRSQARAA